MIGTSDGQVFEDETHYHLDPHIKESMKSDSSSGIKGVYLIRHGTTDLNAESGSPDRIRGWQDVPLSKQGKEEADNLGRHLADSGIQVIHSSDLGRARETAEAVAKYTGAELKTTPKLRPWHVGHLTGTSSVSAHPQLSKYASDKPDEKIPEGESFNEFKERSFQGLHEALIDAGNKKLAIVAHHRNERLFNGWSELGQPENHEVHLDTFLQKGEPPGSAQIMPIKLVESASLEEHNKSPSEFQERMRFQDKLRQLNPPRTNPPVKPGTKIHDPNGMGRDVRII